MGQDAARLRWLREAYGVSEGPPEYRAGSEFIDIDGRS
jgi:hypothetical protein